MTGSRATRGPGTDAPGGGPIVGYVMGDPDLPDGPMIPVLDPGFLWVVCIPVSIA